MSQLIYTYIYIYMVLFNGILFRLIFLKSLTKCTIKSLIVFKKNNFLLHFNFGFRMVHLIFRMSSDATSRGRSLLGWCNSFSKSWTSPSQSPHIHADPNLWRESDSGKKLKTAVTKHPTMQLRFWRQNCMRFCFPATFVVHRRCNYCILRNE